MREIIGTLILFWLFFETIEMSLIYFKIKLFSPVVFLVFNSSNTVWNVYDDVKSKVKKLICFNFSKLYNLVLFFNTLIILCWLGNGTQKIDIYWKSYLSATHLKEKFEHEFDGKSQKRTEYFIIFSNFSRIWRIFRYIQVFSVV